MYTIERLRLRQADKAIKGLFVCLAGPWITV
jgi:hypothetical protein